MCSGMVKQGFNPMPYYLTNELITSYNGIILYLRED